VNTPLARAESATTSAITVDAQQPRALHLISLVREIGDEAALINAFPTHGDGMLKCVAHARALHQIQEQVDKHDASVVVIDSNVIHESQGLEAFGRLVRDLHRRARGGVIVVAIAYGSDWVPVFKRCECDVILAGPLNALAMDKLRDEMPGALAGLARKRESGGYTRYLSAEAEALLAQGEYRPQTISVWSTKGGVGKSLISSEIAIALGVLANKRTVLVDADMDVGDQHTYLKLPADRNIHGLANAFLSRGKLTPAMVEDYLIPYDGQLFVINGLHDMEMTAAEAVRGAQGERFCDALIQALDAIGFTFSVWDLGTNYHEALHLAPLKRCSLNFMVVTAELACVNEMIPAIADLRDTVSLSEHRFRLILNKWTDEAGVSAKEIVRQIGLAESGRIPLDALTVLLAQNHAAPLVLGKPGPVSNALIDIASIAYPALRHIWRARGGASRSGPARGLLGSLFGRRAQRQEVMAV
jgi:MinD-like ATPase involved in chromosome partitioning or flagellar assembly